MESIYQDLNTRFGNDKGQIEMDRTLAIKKAIDRSQEGDWIIITGKGHEKYSHQFSLPTRSDKETIQYLADGHSSHKI